MLKYDIIKCQLIERIGVMEKLNEILTKIDDYVWGLPLIIAILSIGVFLSFRVKFLQIFHLHKGFYFMFKKEKGGKGGLFGAAAAARQQRRRQ